MPLREDDPGLTNDLLDKALDGMILSASGWRGVFPQSGEEESSRAEISPAHAVIAAAAAWVFAEYVKNLAPASPGPELPAELPPEIILGMDTRPTGPAIAEVMLRVFLAEGCAVRFVGITAAPEIMAYARGFASGTSASPPSGGPGVPGASKPCGFIYISASHNPIGHNGLKFGLTDGGVLPGSETAVLIEKFRAFMALPDRIARVVKLVNRADAGLLGAVYAASPQVKEEAFRAYGAFTREVISGSSGKTAEDLFGAIAGGIRERPLGIAVDFNGSARTLSIDREFFSSLGMKFYAINDKPGEIKHRIVPEGESLEPCRLFLEKVHAKDPSVVLGYLPDCDGDRGNLVIWDEGEKRARSLEAQEVFALACAAELACLVFTGELSYDQAGNAKNKVALAVNDPTSLRIDRIARAFDVSVFRAEVGEANAVTLARKLRERGYRVRILGEGSAGGTITHPSAVRDPLDTVGALLKFLTIRSVAATSKDAAGRKGLFELWCDLSNQAETYRADFTIADIIASLPAFVTTGAYTPEAVLRVKTADHSLLKDRYQKIFLAEWEGRKDQLKARYGIAGWEAAAYNGIEEKRGLSHFGDAGQGGLKISFSNEVNRVTACIWMRGSRTEQVFRVMADAEGSDPRMEKDLIEWQRRMVLAADNKE